MAECNFLAIKGITVFCKLHIQKSIRVFCKIGFNWINKNETNDYGAGNLLSLKGVHY